MSLATILTIRSVGSQKRVCTVLCILFIILVVCPDLLLISIRFMSFVPHDFVS